MIATDDVAATALLLFRYLLRYCYAITPPLMFATLPADAIFDTHAFV